MTRIFAASIIVLGFAVSAAAQPPQWTEKVKLGKWVYVTTQTGERVDGVTGQITEEGLVVATPVGVRTVPYREMRWVQKRDAAWPGALIGAAAGVGLAYGAARLITILRPQFFVVIEARAVGLAVLVGLAMALVGALFPARAVAGLAPAEVFRR